jgi:tRNA(fMet)-specific endonuclease VapC
MILLDTDHFSVLVDSRHAQHARLVARLSDRDEPAAIPVIAVEEQLRAWLAQVHRAGDVYRQVSPYDRLIRLIEVLREWEIVRWSQEAADEFSGLRKARVHIGSQDLKIAAMALVHGSLLLSANLRDFAKVPGLRVEDWLYDRPSPR